MNYERLSDEELLGRIVEGEGDALEALYDRHAGLVFSLARRITGDREAAEEVVQDTFLTVWRQAASYSPSRGRPYSWLVRIARNRSIDELRRMDSRERRQRRSREVLDAYTPDPALKAVEDAREAELRRLVSEALQDLPEPQREVVELSYFRGWSQVEISRRTGLPLGTVKTRMRLALSKLRNALRREAKGTPERDGI
ncbi:sigma-70 family RNA polymerase sigma factor [Rubrobacter taiwanensis]|uniref:RNA polymerase sigma factor n=1 Tax=Rubrobacter taiwanensis TaxID=185139 RepID=A0A4R1BQE4_9ACTN|nr:sigma-70 family RNA polymerase sigma factor [Rubrobacter taiwanensis]TCJ19811.1 sigma-70 family RNA polymerase sigma factor [Rubrobacter taiwanensis]